MANLVQVVVIIWCTASLGAAHAQESTVPSIELGRYIAEIGGCNDCHTNGYAPSNGQVPEDQWLKGLHIGFRGPWGTTYPANLRLRLGEMTEDEWVQFARTFKTRPPMPWYDVNKMTERDLRSFYRFVTSLGDAGEPSPEYVPPHQEPTTPFIVFVPQDPK